MIRPLRLFATAGLILGLAISAFASDQALLILKSQNYSDTEATMEALDKVGAHADHVFPPNTIIAYVPIAAEAGVRSLSNVASFYRGPAPAPADGNSVQTIGVSAWNYILQPEPASSTVGSPLVGDVVSVPRGPVPAGMSSGTPTAAGLTSYAPGYNQTSSFLAGKIAVGLILPESTGNYENWNKSQPSQVTGEVLAGTNWWVNKNRSTVPLTFIYDTHLAVATQYEPIQMDNDVLWINDCLKKLGNYSDTWAYDNAIRNTLHTDWAFTYYVVNSLTDPDGKFPSGFFGYAGLGGPSVVMTYDNDGWGITGMDQVARHEMGHIFGCGDEYCAPGYACCTMGYYGYLNVFNGNCQLDNPNQVPCVMVSNGDAMCDYTVGQLGWTDSDNDGLPDVIDNEVKVSLDPVPVPVRLATYTFTGVANNVPCPSPSFSPVTINKISSVKCSVDGGTWMDASPLDGSFNLDVEQFQFTTPALANGHHKIEIQATATPSGNKSDILSYEFDVADPDLTPPTVTSVVDEGSVIYDDSQLVCDVTATDPDTGVYGYQYAIGTTPTDPGSGYVKGWTNVGNTTHIIAGGLQLTANNTYYFYVKAKNGSDIWSASTSSDGIKVELISIGKAKLLPDGTRVLLKDKIITMGQGWPVILFYVEEPDRSAAIRVVADRYVADGSKITLRGTLLPVSASTNNERQLQATVVSSGIGTMPRPVGLVGRSIVGGTVGLLPGLPLATGMNNTGLLVRIVGKVTRFEDYHYYISDGSTINGQPVEVCVNMNPASVSATVGRYQLITGISSIYAPNGMGAAVPMIQPRSMADVRNL